MSIAQEIAEQDSERLGFGYFDLLPKHKTWVLARMRIDFKDTPRWKDRLTAETWHRGLDGPFFTREARLTDREGNVKVSAISSWVIIDTDTRAMVMPSKASLFVNPEPACDERNGENCPKIQFPKQADGIHVCCKTVSYSDIDHNAHTNNAVYVKWAMDCIPQDITLKRSCTQLSINFNKETTPSEEVQLRWVCTEDSDLRKEFLVEGRSDGFNVFCARILF